MEKLLLPAQIENLEPMIDFVVRCAQKIDFDPPILNKIRLVAEEALINIINYAYPQKRGDIEIACKDADTSGITIEISDSGIAFNPLSIPEPDLTLPMEKRKIGGLGIHMIRTTMDRVSYKRENNKNIFTLVKYK